MNAVLGRMLAGACLAVATATAAAMCRFATAS